MRNCLKLQVFRPRYAHQLPGALLSYFTTKHIIMKDSTTTIVLVFLVATGFFAFKAALGAGPELTTVQKAGLAELAEFDRHEMEELTPADRLERCFRQATAKIPVAPDFELVIASNWDLDHSAREGNQTLYNKNGHWYLGAALREGLERLPLTPEQAAVSYANFPYKKLACGPINW